MSQVAKTLKEELALFQAKLDEIGKHIETEIAAEKEIKKGVPHLRHPLLPEADGLGFTMHYSAPRSTTYIDYSGISLEYKTDQWGETSQELSFTVDGVIHVSTGWFSAPHKSFRSFYNRIAEARLKLNS